MSFLYRSLFILCLIFVVAQTAEAGNTVSANFGEPIPAISWNVGGAPSCTATTSYPVNADGIRNSWTTLSPLPSGSGSHNFQNRNIGAAAGTYFFTCSTGGVADTSTLVVCNNTTLESDGGAACVAKTPTTPTGLTATAGACGTSQINLSWNTVVGATAYTVRDGSTVIYSGAANSYPHTGLTAGSPHGYTVRAQNGALNSPYSAVVNRNAPAVCTYPDLTVQSTTLPSGTLTAGTPVTLLGTVRNNGSVTTGGGFYNNFSYDTGSGWVDLPDISKGILAAGTNATQDSQSFTPSVGTVRFQYCVDSNNQIAESTGETPNCVQSAFVNVIVPAPGAPTGLTLNTAPVPACGGRMTASWNSVSGATDYKISIDGGVYVSTAGATIYSFNSLVPGSSHTIRVVASNSTGDSAPASATANASAACSSLTVGNCTISDLSRTCNTTASWDITGAVAPSIYNVTRGQTVPGSNTVIGNNVPVTLERSRTISNETTGENIIEARDGASGIPGSDSTAIASCGALSFFHTDAAEDRCQPVPSIVITPNPAWIRSGDQANLSAGVLANYPNVTCDVTGGVPAGTTFGHTASASRTNHPITTNPLTAAQVVRVSCTAPGLTTPVTQEVRVNVLPDVQEI